MTEDEVKEYIDNYLSHIIEMVEYGNWFADEINQLVEETRHKIDLILEPRLICKTKSICKEILSEIDKELELLEEKVNELIDEELIKLVDSEDEWLDEFVAEPLGVSFTKPSKGIALLKNLPIATAGIVGLYGKTISDRLKNIYQQQVMQSYVTSTPIADLEEFYEPRFNTFGRGLQADSETLGSALSGQYDRMVYTKNDNQIKGYVWSAMLDTRTCIVCGDLDGRKFDDLSKVPFYPAHDHCRCTLIPFSEDTEENIPESYTEWFEHQSDSDKYKILGKTRFQLYEQGMKIKSFVNNGKKTPLKDLNFTSKV